MTTSLPKPAPVVFLVVPVSPGPVNVENQIEGKVHPLAGLPCSGLASMAATIATGLWPESHGVVTRIQPHPDRLGYEVVRPDRATGNTVWSRAVDSGRHVGLCNWPHESMKAGCDGEGRLDWIDPEAVLGLSGEVEGVLPPASFSPAEMRPALLESMKGTETDTVFAGLELLADRGPDLLVGWLPEVAADSGPQDEWMEQLRRRLGNVASMDATLLVLELPPAGDSIFQQVRGGSAPRLRVIGPRTPSISGRPWLDRIHDLLCDMLACGDAGPRATPATRVGGPGRLDAAGFPTRSRLSSFDLKQFEQTRSREIGASLAARGRHADSEPWLAAAVENQHGMIDAPVVGLLFASFVRRRNDDAARRLLTSVRDRFPRPIIEVLLSLLDGGSDGLRASGHLAALVDLGPFAMQTIVLEFVRRGVLSRNLIRAR
ncbi:MAG: alkaline phosphatase family protein [Phycisphaerales bacterium]|nr:alkaline phosphatase family protein [Phycisphaerales bacterium]